MSHGGCVSFLRSKEDGERWRGQRETDKFRANSARKFPEKYSARPPPAVPSNFKNKRALAPVKTMDIPSILRPTLLLAHTPSLIFHVLFSSNVLVRTYVWAVFLHAMLYYFFLVLIQ